LFVVAAAESLPGELLGVADEVRVQFPWGSLRTAFVDGPSKTAAAIGRLLSPGGRLTVLINDAPGVTTRIAGLTLVDARDAGADDVAEARSTWAKRLGVGPDRPARVASFVRDNS
jgi:16S rRNA (adenine(1408)-N(1))-methyltransferase